MMGREKDKVRTLRREKYSGDGKVDKHYRTRECETNCVCVFVF